MNYLKSEPGGGRILVDFPGEFRLLGALWKPAVDVTPLDTAIRGRGLSKHFGLCVKKHFMSIFRFLQTRGKFPPVSCVPSEDSQALD